MMHSKSTPVYLTFKLLQTQKAKSCHEYFLNQHSPLLLCLRNRTTLSFFLIFFFKFFFVLKAMHFSYMGRLVTNKQKFKFSVLIFACRLVLYLYACAIENPKISGFRVSEIRALPTDHTLKTTSSPPSYPFLVRPSLRFHNYGVTSTNPKSAKFFLDHS